MHTQRRATVLWLLFHAALVLFSNISSKQLPHSNCQVNVCDHACMLVVVSTAVLADVQSQL